MPEVRWGILGAAAIAAKVASAIKEAGNATCVAVASREKGKAETFVRAHCPEAIAYGSYEALLEDDRVEVVYIPLPTGIRTEWVLKAAARKKHVLCEKPIAPTEQEVARMLKGCRDAGVQFMDNTMLMHGERMQSICQVIKDAELFGAPRHVTSTFTIPRAMQESWATSNIRMKQALEPHGCLGDLGWYCARLSLVVFGGESPEAVSCHFLEETSEGVPVQAAATLRFSGGRTAVFDCSYKLAFRNWAEIVSDKCALSVKDFVIPAKADVCDFTVYKVGVGDRSLTFPIEIIKVAEFRGTAQHTALVEKMSSIAASGKLEEFWPHVAAQTQRLIDALMASARQQGGWVPLGGAQPEQSRL